MTHHNELANGAANMAKICAENAIESIVGGYPVYSPALNCARDASFWQRSAATWSRIAMKHRFALIDGE